MRALLFPGQGSQYVGMGSDFYENYKSVRDIFSKVDETLGFSLSNIILKGPESDLKLTQNTQPAIMTVGVSIFNVLKNNFNLNLKNIKFFAGHSLGEYTALVCAGALSLERAAYLLYERGKSMQESVPKDEGGMLAVLGMTMTEVENELKILPKEDVCEIANDNCEGQIVVSGKKKQIEILNQNLKVKKKKGIFLPVSAPFHCSLMKSASIKMKDKIEETDLFRPNPSIISNVTAKEEYDINRIKTLLVDQITSKERWRDSVEYMIKENVTDFLEIGPGKVLSSLVKKINRSVRLSNVIQ